MTLSAVIWVTKRLLTSTMPNYDRIQTEHVKTIIHEIPSQSDFCIDDASRRKSDVVILWTHR